MKAISGAIENPRGGQLPVIPSDYPTAEVVLRIVVMTWQSQAFVIAPFRTLLCIPTSPTVT